MAYRLAVGDTPNAVAQFAYAVAGATAAAAVVYVTEIALPKSTVAIA
jgi:hypothetical protein